MLKAHHFSPSSPSHSCFLLILVPRPLIPPFSSFFFPSPLPPTSFSTQQGDGTKTFLLLFASLLLVINERIGFDASHIRPRLVKLRHSLTSLRRALWRNADVLRHRFFTMAMPTSSPSTGNEWELVCRLLTSCLKSASAVTRKSAVMLADRLTRLLRARCRGFALTADRLDYLIQVQQ